MKLFKKNLIDKKHKKMIFCTLGAVLLAGLVFFFSYFHVSKVEVMGTARYSDEEVKSMALQGAFTDNSVLAVLLHSRVDVEDVPFVEGFNITRLSHNSICISVREKKAVGCIPYLDSYVYFDRNGIFIESSHTRDELVPFFDGIQVSHVIQGEKLPIKGSSVLTTAVALSTIFQKNDVIPDHIEFDSQLSDHPDLRRCAGYVGKGRVPGGQDDPGKRDPAKAFRGKRNPSHGECNGFFQAHHL